MVYGSMFSIIRSRDESKFLGVFEKTECYLYVIVTFMASERPPSSFRNRKFSSFWKEISLCALPAALSGWYALSKDGHILVACPSLL